MSDEAFITARYSCHACGIDKKEVAVKARGDEDVVQWMENACANAVAEDHAATSPQCRAQSVSALLIPINRC